MTAGRKRIPSRKVQHISSILTLPLKLEHICYISVAWNKLTLTETCSSLNPFHIYIGELVTMIGEFSENGSW